jgi:ribosomal protein S27AE
MTKEYYDKVKKDEKSQPIVGSKEEFCPVCAIPAIAAASAGGAGLAATAPKKKRWLYIGILILIAIISCVAYYLLTKNKTCPTCPM